MQISTKQKVYQFEDFILDQSKRQLFFDNSPINLTSKNFEILSLLIENRGNLVEKQEIFDIVWVKDFVQENNLPVHISALRKIFRQKGINEDIIKTVSGRGYVFTAQVLEVIPIQNKTDSSIPNNITTSSKAYDLYFKGQYILETIPTRIKLESDLYQAIDFFKSAIKIDPNFSQAYYGNVRSLFYLHNYGYLEKEDAFLKCEILLRQAEEINLCSSETFFIRGLVNFAFKLDILQAKDFCHKAVEIDPTNAAAFQYLGIIYTCLGEFDLAMFFAIKAAELNPTNIGIRIGIVRIYYCLEDYNKAIAEGKENFNLDNRSFATQFIFSMIYARLNLYDEAIKWCDGILRNLYNTEVRFLKAYIFLLQGHPQEADQLIRKSLTDEKQICANLLFIVLIYTAQNKFDEALDLLLKYCDKAHFDILTIKVEPGLKPLQKDKRFQIVLEKLNLV